MANDQRQTIAEIYAQALFELATELGQVDSVLEQLDSLSSAIRADREFEVFLSTPAIDKERKKASLERIFKDRLSDLVHDFLMVTTRHGRLELLVDIAKEFNAFADHAAGRVRGLLTTAVQLDRSECLRLEEQIGRALRKDVLLSLRIDPSIIGGMIVAVEGKVLDASVKGNLKRITQQMRKQSQKVSYTA